MSHGGKRAGAGRPPRTDGAQPCEFVLSAAARAMVARVQRELESSGEQRVTASAVVERAIMRGLPAALGKAMRRRIAGGDGAG